MKCNRCGQEIEPGAYNTYIQTIGTVCYHCAEVVAGDDDLNDPWDGTKIC
jgi:hypothetical protein